LLYIRYLSRGGGAALQFELLARHLWVNGHRAVPACGFASPAGQYARRLRSEGLPLLRLGNLSKGLAARFGLLRPVWALLGTRVVHVFLPDGAELIRLAARSGRRVVYSEAGTPDAGNPYWSALRPVLRDIARATAVSRSGGDALRDVLGYAGPVTVIASAVADTGPVQRPHAERPVTVVYAGRLVPGKNVDLLIRAFTRLVAQLPAGACRLLVIGDGPEGETLRAAAAATGAAEAIEFTGLLPNPDVRQRLADAELFCLPSASEGTPSTVLEAMAAGLPVLASRAGGIPELVEDGVTGTLVPAGDEPALAEALFILCRDADLRRRLGQAGRERYRAGFTPEALLPRYVAVYAQLGIGPDAR
jgi:glycosyltransferase involved in cell wall biosynthesis